MLLPAEVRSLSAIVHVADHLAAGCALGFSRSVDGSATDLHVAEWLGLSAEQLSDMLTEVPVLVRDVSPLFGGDVITRAA